MNVRDLIAQLRMYDETTEVLVLVDRGTWVELKSVDLATVKRSEDGDHYYQSDDSNINAILLDWY